MAYTIITLRGALKEMGVARVDKPFVWQATDKAVNPKLQQQFPYGRPKADYEIEKIKDTEKNKEIERIKNKDPNNLNRILNDLTEYCWIAYSKSFERSGPHIIGRTGDLWVPEYLERAGITDKKTQTLWDASVMGNIQLLDKWAPVVNDCWVLGGVHRRADFELVSVRSVKNLWDYEQGFHVVTGRELLGLLHFGYSMTEGPASIWLKCTDAAKAKGATVEEYSSFMEEQQRIGPDSIRTLIAGKPEVIVDPKLRKDIEGFDKSRLKHVVPPR